MEISLELDNATGKYFPGQLFEGKVIINSPNKAALDTIYVQLYGKAHVDFETGYGKYSFHCADTELVLNRTVTLVGEDRKQEFISPGLSEFPFLTVLPEKLPSTTCEKYGTINYHCVAGVRESNSENSLLTPPQEFQVNGLLNLKGEAKVLTPVLFEETRKLTSCCWSSGFVKCTIKLPKSGFIPGENIPLVVDIDNQSNKNVCPSVTFRKKIYFQGKKVLLYGYDPDPTYTLKWATTKIDKIKGKVMESRGRESWILENLLVVQSQPSFGVEDCKIIRVMYELKVKLKIENSDLVTCKIPIVIGTSALR